MFIAAARARKLIQYNFRLIGYEPDEAAWLSIRMGIKRDLQARKLRPNAPIPSRRNPLRYLGAMFRETGSIYRTLISYLHDGAWTSSGGSFRLAEELGFDLVQESVDRLRAEGTFRYLEVGGGWAGLRTPASDNPRDIAGLARHFRNDLGERVFLHFTNLTCWHTELPKGITEHPYVTAAGLSVVDTQGVAPGSISILYSQAAAYFETDVASFIAAASALLRPGGLLIFNIPPAQVVSVMNCARKRGLRLGKWRDLGGMNGIVVAFEKRASLPKPGFVEWPSQGSGRTNRGQLEERHPHVSN